MSRWRSDSDPRDRNRLGWSGPDALDDGGATARVLERGERELEREERRRERQRPGRDLSRDAREAAALRDLGIFGTVALVDLIEERFGGHRYIGRKIVNYLKRHGLVREDVAGGPRGGKFRVLWLTRKGVALVREAHRGDPRQRWWHGGGRGRQEAHDAAVYRAAMAAGRELRAEGKRVRRVVTEAELKSEVARPTETARVRSGTEAARAARQRAAADLGLPVQRGVVLFPDVRIEWEDALGNIGRCDIEVASKHYTGAAVRAKQAAGFQMYAAGGGSRRSALRGLRSVDSGSSGGRRFTRDEEWFSF